MSSNADRNDAGISDEESMRTQRLEEGKCPNCGTQLYQLQKGKKTRLLKRFLPGGKEARSEQPLREPLNVEGQVLRGQCLQCAATTQITDVHQEQNDGTFGIPDHHVVAVADVLAHQQDAELEAVLNKIANEENVSNTRAEEEHDDESVDIENDAEEDVEESEDGESEKSEASEEEDEITKDIPVKSCAVLHTEHLDDEVGIADGAKKEAIEVDDGVSVEKTEETAEKQDEDKKIEDNADTKSTALSSTMDTLHLNGEPDAHAINKQENVSDEGEQTDSTSKEETVPEQDHPDPKLSATDTTEIDDTAEEEPPLASPVKQPSSSVTHAESKSTENEEAMEWAAQPTIAAIPINTTTATQLSTTTSYKGPLNTFGNRHGEGELVWSNGDRYVGQFWNGVRQGHGTLHFAQGAEYVGSWENNKIHGEGTQRFPNGDVYTGHYVNGKRSGQGRCYFANGDLYKGSWHNDQPNGHGQYYYNHGQVYEGMFRNGQRHGMGKYQLGDGRVDVYRYKHDERDGEGVRWSANRKKAWRLLNCKVKGRVSFEQAEEITRRIKNG